MLWIGDSMVRQQSLGRDTYTQPSAATRHRSIKDGHSVGHYTKDRYLFACHHGMDRILCVAAGATYPL